MTLPATWPAKTYAGKDATTLLDVLDGLDARVRYNLRTSNIEIEVSPPVGSGGWKSIHDRNTAWLRDLIAKNCVYRLGNGGEARLSYGIDSFQDCLNVLAATREVDPFIEWLEKLPHWDGESRIDTLLCDLFGAAETPLVQWASRYLCLGAVQRSYQPGCKLDEIVVLIAPQGRGKSTVLAELLPPEHPEFFSDSLKFDGRTKEMTEALLGRVIVEAGEMAGVGRADLASLKAFITRRDDGSVRLAYRRNPEPMPRRCVIVGSVDRPECLPNDPAGLRRFVPVILPHGCHVEKVIPPIREQLWAEALDRYQKGERANLPRDLIPTAAAVAEEHRTRNTILEDAIASADLTSPDGHPLGQIAEIIGIASTGEGARLSRTQQMQLATGLTTAGFQSTRTRRDGRQVTVWTSPETTLGFGDGASDGF